MIKAQELRMGNLVTDEFYDSFNTIICVESINDNGVNLDISDDGNYPEIASYYIEPDFKIEKLRGMPITENRLLELGFIEDVKTSFLKDRIRVEMFMDDWRVRFQVDEDKSYFIKRIKYIHQLQNLYHAFNDRELTSAPPR